MLLAYCFHLLVLLAYCFHLLVLCSHSVDVGYVCRRLLELVFPADGGLKSSFIYAAIVIQYVLGDPNALWIVVSFRLEPSALS